LIQLEIEIPIIVSDSCLVGEDQMTDSIQVLCAYSLGGVLPAGGQILESRLLADPYYETRYWLDGDKLIFEIIDDFGESKENFYSEVLDRYKNFPVSYKALYQGPDFEIDENVVGKAVAPY